MKTPAQLADLASAYAGAETDVYLSPADFESLKELNGGGDGLPDVKNDGQTHVKVSAEKLCEIVAANASADPAEGETVEREPAAPEVPEDLNSVGVKELRAIAKHYDIELASGLDKAGVVEAVDAGLPADVVRVPAAN
ncbi:hypothetical protein [Alienimonas sp. DA493]|uniref:hypothetical protein n=1 Tax=Alienimonas sp. DA493 TaxID=3373605 RepID=UPI003754C7DF